MAIINYISTFISLTSKNFKKVITNFWDSFLKKSSFVKTYYIRSENIWNDGFLFDFLQKKTADAWVRRFVIYTGFLFSERLVFDYIVRIYLDNLIWPLHEYSIFETLNVSEMLLNVLFFYLSLLLTILSVYILIL